MFGEVNADGEMSGKSLAYIYPDGRTALYGSFVEGEIIEARSATMISKENERPRFEVAPNSKFVHHQDIKKQLDRKMFYFEGPVYSYDKSTSTCIATHTLLPDPYESRR